MLGPARSSVDQDRGLDCAERGGQVDGRGGAARAAGAATDGDHRGRTAHIFQVRLRRGFLDRWRWSNGLVKGRQAFAANGRDDAAIDEVRLRVQAQNHAGLSLPARIARIGDQEHQRNARRRQLGQRSTAQAMQVRGDERNINSAGVDRLQELIGAEASFRDAHVVADAQNWQQPLFALGVTERDG